LNCSNSDHKTLQEAASKLPASRTSNLPPEYAAAWGVKEVRTPSFPVEDWDIMWPLARPDIGDHFALDITDGQQSHTIGFRREGPHETRWAVFDTNLQPPSQALTDDTFGDFMQSWFSLYAEFGYPFSSLQVVRYQKTADHTNLNRRQGVCER
jgi:hypothetical protein